MVQRELTQEEIEAIDSLNGQTTKTKSFLSKSKSSSSASETGNILISPRPFSYTR